MRSEKLIEVVRRFEEENGFVDVLYLEAIRKLERVRENQQELDQKITRRIIRPFLASWGRMGRNIERPDFDWDMLIEAIENQRENLDKLKKETILDVRLDKVASTVEEVYGGIKVKHLGPTGISKVLHLFNPELFVMWDTDIRRNISSKPFSASSRGYLNFLKWIQGELIEAIKSCNIEEIRNEIGGEYIDGKTLAKLVDEYCWWTVRQNE